MRIGFLTNEYPFDKLSQISSFYQWLQAKKIDVIVIACDRDNFKYDKKSKVLFLPFKNLNDVMELESFILIFYKQRLMIHSSISVRHS